MSQKVNFELMGIYNQWMNSKIYDAAAGLSASELAEDRGAYFGSFIGTLNHILVGDTIWLKRFASHPGKLKSLDYVRGLESPAILDAILFPGFDDLHNARTAMDHTIRKFSRELTSEIISSPLSYTSTSGESFTKNFGHLIQHFFNHQTHHRGQISTLFNQMGVDIGVTDLLAGIPEIELDSVGPS